MTRWFGVVLTLATLACGSAARAAPDATVPVTLDSFIGMPNDSTSRREFFDAFQAAFDAGELPQQKREGDRWASSGEQRSRFRLVDAAPSDAAWKLSLSIGLPARVLVAQRKRKESDPPPRSRMSEVRTSRGLTIAVTATSPDATGSDEPPAPIKFAVFFPDARRVVVPTAKLPSGGYAFPWADAGSVVARAALEALHRANHWIAVDERADLAPAQRTEDQP